MAEILDIVDENNKIIGKTTKDQILKENLIHRGVVIFLFNKKDELFVHQRTNNMIIYPGMWSMTLGGSVVSGENFLKAAERETREEVGISNPKPEFLFFDRYQSPLDNVIAAVYKLIYEGKITAQKEEIVKGFFVSLKKLEKMMEEKSFCPDAIQYFNKLKKTMSK